MKNTKTVRLGSALILVYSDNLTHEYCEPLKEYLQTLVTMQDYEHMVIDISGLGTIDNCGLHLLVSLTSRVRGHGKMFHLMSPPRHFLELLQDKQLLRFFNIFRKEDDMCSSLPI